MAKLLLQRPQDSDIVGIHLAGSNAAVTIRRDGLSLWSTETLTPVSTYPLGPGAEELETRAVVCADAGVMCAVLSDVSTKHQSLVRCPLKNTSTKPKTLGDLTPRIPLPAGSKAHSLHVLQPAAQLQPRSKHQPRPPSCIALVLKQGQVAWMLPTAQDLLLHVLPSTSPSPRTHLKAAASIHDTLALLTQPSAGSSAHLQLFAWKDGALSALGSMTAACPSPAASATNLSLAPSYALISWSDDSVSVLPSTPSVAAANGLHVKLSNITHHAPAGAGAEPDRPSSSTPAANGPPSARKKRRPGEDPVPSPACTHLTGAFDDTQFLVGWLSAAPEAQGGGRKSSLHFVLVDAKFGCSASSGTVLLELPFAPHARCAASCGDGSSPGEMLLQVGGAVLSLRLEAPAASLLSLVGRLSLSPPTPAAAAAAAAPPGAVWSMNLKALAEQPAAAGVRGGGVLLSPAPATAMIEREAAAEGRRLQEQLEAAAAAGPGPRPDHGELQQQALAYVTRAQQQPVRRLRAEMLPTRLLTLLAKDLAASEQWGGLQQLLEGVPLQGLQGCSELLPAVAAAMQYQLLGPLCCKLDEVGAADVVAALRWLLGATAAANLGPRRGHYQALRATAEAAIARAEAQLSRAFKTYERREVLAFAQCAAAAVDGFSYREVLLHALLAMPVDAPGLQACLAALDNTLVDRLLTYLAKWVDKYTRVLGEGAAAAPLPQELLFPTLPQVLEWVRLVLDAHLARLMMAAEAPAHVARLTAALGLQLSACRQLLPLMGGVEHIQQQALLPAAHVAAATQYTVELLDLSIRT